MECIARRRVRRNIAGIAILLTAMAPGARPLVAQDEPPARRPAGQPVSIAGTLAAVLDKIVWDPSKSGVLLIVAPERTRPQSANPLANLISLAEEPDRSLPDALKPPPLPPPGAAGYRLDALAPVLRRRRLTSGRCGPQSNR